MDKKMSSPMSDVCDWLPSESVQADLDTIANSNMPSDDEMLLNDAYEQLVDYTHNNTPSIVRILLLHTSMENKMQLLMLYQGYQVTKDPLQRFQIFKAYTSLYNTCTQEEQSGVSAANSSKESSAASPSPVDLLIQIKAADVDPKRRAVLMEKYRQWNMAKNSGDGEFRKVQQWLQNALRLPFQRAYSYPEVTPAFLRTVRADLDRELFGLNAAKEQVLSALLTKFKGVGSFQILGLIGPPGVGKTKLAFTLSRTLGIPFAYLSFGGIQNVETLKGHDYTYLASQPGMLSKALMTLGVNNGIIYIDEFDKALQNESCVGTLLHLLDPEQNSRFVDNYFQDLELDFSNTWFILSMNNYTQHAAIVDRITYIEIPPYSEEDKVRILHDYMFSKELQRYVDAGLLPAMRLTFQAAEHFLALLIEYEDCFADIGGQSFPTLRNVKHVLHLVFQRMVLTHALRNVENPTDIMASFSRGPDTLASECECTRDGVRHYLLPILKDKRKARMCLRRRSSTDKLSMYQ